MKKNNLFGHLIVNANFVIIILISLFLYGCNADEVDGSQTNGDIAFVSDRDGVSRIYVMNKDGKNVRQVTDDDVLIDEGEEYTFPSFSRDGTKLAFVIYPYLAQFGIGKVNVDGSDKRLITSGVPGLQMVNQISTPTWTSYEDVYFVAGNPLSLYYYSGNTGVNSITGDELCYSIFGCDMHVSPDACLYDDSGIILGITGNLILNAELNGQASTLLSGISYNETPSYSPNGKKIVSSSGMDIYVMNADGSNAVKLTNGTPGTNLNSRPVWSPDGKKIAFDTNRDGNYEIYVMNIDGSNQTNLTNSNSNNYAPTWASK